MPVRLLTLLAFVGPLSACQFIPGTDAAMIREAEEAVRYQALDAASVQFRNERVIRNSATGPAVCGEYNAKNGFGALAGFRPFLYNSKDRKLVTLPDNPLDESVVSAAKDFSDQCLAATPAAPPPETRRSDDSDKKADALAKEADALANAQEAIEAEMRARH